MFYLRKVAFTEEIIIFFNLLAACGILVPWSEVKVAQSCPTLCDPMDYTVHGILQARILEWVAIPFSRGCPQPRDQTEVSQIAGGFFTSWATRGNPRRLEWITYPFSSRSSQPRNWIGVSCISGRFITNWAIRKSPQFIQIYTKSTYSSSNNI